MPRAGAATVVVVPCFDEADRLPRGELAVLADADGVALTLVDDGSTDRTAEMLAEFAAGRPDVEVVRLPANVGKAQAVRAGLTTARARGAQWVAFCDADFATPAHELLRLIDIARARPDLAVVVGSRLALLGRTVHRSPWRHAGGRVFAAGAARVLQLPVHDTQCGAKVLRVDAALAAALAEPFRSRWAFDVELLGRLAALGVPADGMWEEPLHVWRDVAGSKRSLRAAVQATCELVPIAGDLRRWSGR